MAQLGQQFDARAVAPTEGFAAWPEGRYKAIIEKSEIVETNDKTGRMLRLHWRCIEGPMNGQTTPENLNLWNSNPQAVSIANNTLSAICHCSGQYVVNDSASLHNIPMTIEIAHTKDDKGNVYGNVKRHYDIYGNPPGKTGVPQNAQPMPPAQQQPAPQQQYAPQQPQQQYPPQQQTPPQYAAPAPAGNGAYDVGGAPPQNWGPPAQQQQQQQQQPPQQQQAAPQQQFTPGAPPAIPAWQR